MDILTTKKKQQKGVELVSVACKILLNKAHRILLYT